MQDIPRSEIIKRLQRLADSLDRINHIEEAKIANDAITYIRTYQNLVATYWPRNQVNQATGEG